MRLPANAAAGITIAAIPDVLNFDINLDTKLL